MNQLQLFALESIPEIRPDDDLASVLISAMDREGFVPTEGDIFVLAHKVVSKAEGRIYHLPEVVPSPEAIRLGKITGKPPALVELILQESEKVLYAAEQGYLLCQHRLGFVCANAAVDCSNAGDENAILLPLRPDDSAQRMRIALEARYHSRFGAIICDTHGKPFREGASGTVIGASGICLLKSYIGQEDRDGRVMKSSVENIGDELAGAATLLMGQGREGCPVCIVRGLSALGSGHASDLIRQTNRDIFLSTFLQKNHLA